jgi:hypothetical protein
MRVCNPKLGFKEMYIAVIKDNNSIQKQKFPETFYYSRLWRVALFLQFWSWTPTLQKVAREDLQEASDASLVFNQLPK